MIFTIAMFFIGHLSFEKKSEIVFLFGEKDIQDF